MRNILFKTNFNLCVKITFILLAIMAADIGANGATFTVTNTNDSGAGSLRQALADAADGDTIDFAVTGAIVLTTGQLTVNKNVNISGPGADQLAVQRSTNAGIPLFRIFEISSGKTVTISGLTITNGNVNVASGISNFGTLTLNNSAVTGNRADGASGIYNSGTLTLNNSTVSGNSAAGGGGGIVNGSGSTTLNYSTVRGNSAKVGGGGIYSPAGTVTLNYSAVTGNSASNSGGGIYNPSSTLTLNNSTISGNSASRFGGGIYSPDGTLTVTNSTISANKSGNYGGGIYISFGSAIIGNTIIAGNMSPSGPDIINIQSITSNGYNVIGNASGYGSDGFPAAAGDQVGTAGSPIDAMLGPLAYNGGPTMTHALLPGSPAIDKGQNSGGLSSDQRGAGFARTYDNPGKPNANGGDGTDIGSFEVQQPCSSCSFAAAANFAIGNLPVSETTGDFNGDGKLDVATSNIDSNTVSILIGDGLGGFAPATNFAVGSGPFSVTAGDFNGDGKLDLATANLNPDNVSVLLGDGSGGFAPATNFAAGDGPASVAAGDFNGDGKLDIAVANINSDNVSVLLGDGSGGFAPATNFATGDGPVYVISGDFNGDGKLDIAAANTNSDNVSVLLGDGSGSFAPAANFAFGDGSVSLTAGDFNGDGNLDLAAPSLYSPIVSVRLGDGSGAFGPVASFGVGNPAYSVTAGDFDGDGKLDLATTGSNANNVSVLMGGGSGAFSTAKNFAVGDAPVFVSAGDFNGDGKLDLAVANYLSKNLSVLLNNCTSNAAPVAKDDSYSTNEDTSLTVAPSGVLSNDSDTEGDTLTAMLVTGTSYGSLTLNADGSFTYTPNANYNGSDTFTYKANDGKLDSNVATVTITVNPVNDAPAVSAAPKTQPDVQYSDPIQQVTVTASDLETPTGNLSIAFSYTRNAGASVAGLPAGMTQGGVAGMWTVSGTAGVAAGTYVITARVTDTGDGAAAPITSFDSFTIVVVRENAVAAPQINNPVSMQVSSAGGTATGTTGQICFAITEVPDGSLGDISLITAATVQISAVGGGSAVGVTPSSVSFSGGGVGGTRSACFTLSLSGAAPNVYEAKLVIGGDYYTGSGTTAFTVFDPSAGFVSGGGWIINPNTGYRANYGVNVKYLKNGNAQGSLLYVEHRPDGDYKVKSTALNSSGGFAIVPITGGSEAQIAGKATYFFNDIGTGNYSFIARVVDKGTPGTNDQFGLQLIDPSGQVVTSFTFNPVTLGGGNNQVPKK